MSAVNSNSSDRETEALRRAQRAHEPSMDEILASIRTIIAEEQSQDKAREPEKAAALRPAPRAVAPLAGPQIVYSKGDAAASRYAPEAVEPQPAPEADSPRVVRRRPEAAASASPEPASESSDEPLLSPESDEAVSSSFGALSDGIAARSLEIAEGMAREMLRPMLKAWLDENLPAIVERLVRAEIQRVARGTR